MKVLKKILMGFLVFTLILSLAFMSYWQYQKPQYAGTKLIASINKSAEVYFDDFGIPHIYAENQHDAMVALGYVHAQDRLWQMELLRRIAPGRLSEIFGNKTLKTDVFFAGLGIDESSAVAVALIDKKSEPYKLTMAYLQGLNEYVDKGKTPVEFHLLGIKKTKFTLKDVYNTFGYMAFSFAMAQKTDPLLTDIRNKYGQEYLVDLGIPIANNSPSKISQNQRIAYSKISKSISILLNQVPAAPFVGSNAWIIGGKKTKSGKVIFCNDPHIEFSQPGTWFEAHISTPDFENYGCYVAGTPFPLLGHNRKHAFGMTMFENDDADFFEIELHPQDPTKYKTATGYEKIGVSKKIIKVKDSLPIVVNVKSTHHGPIINNLMQNFKNNNPVSLLWIHTKQPNKVIEATYGLSHSKSLVEFRQSISQLASPGLNIMYGDSENNIAHFTTGKLYKLQKNVNPNFILNGWNGIDDKKEFFSFNKNPNVTNPAWHYLYSGNNSPKAIDGYKYPGYYLPEDRAKRISFLLEKKTNWDRASAMKMMLDNTSENSSKFVKIILQLIEKKSLSTNEMQAIAILKQWEGENNPDDVAPTIYNKFIYFYLKNTFSDEIGTENFDQLLKTHLVKQIVGIQMPNEKSVWWDDIATTKTIEKRHDIITKSFKESIDQLEIQFGKNPHKWVWKNAHHLEIKHALGRVPALRRMFNIQKTAVAGSNEVINNMMFTYSNEAVNDVKAGPSSRRIIDFSDIENSMSILPSGNSGNPFSKHYADQSTLFKNGKFRKMMLNKTEIISKSTILVLVPKKL